MEQHPIPQDVTGFQFKLIGTMTVKQFGYVAAGAIMAVVMWYAPFKGFWEFLAKGILLPLFGASGVIIAFIPIEGRPIDVMAANFFHAFFSPSQYVYIKKGRRFKFTQVTYTKAAQKTEEKPVNTVTTKVESKKEQQLRALLANSYNNAKSNLDKKEMAFLQTIAATPRPSPQLQTTPVQITNTPIQKPSIHLPTFTNPLAQKTNNQQQPINNPKPAAPAPEKQPKEQSLAQQETLLLQQLALAKQQETNQKTAAEMQASHQKVLELQKQIQEVHAQKEQLEQELLKLRNQLSAQKPAITPATIQAPQTPRQDPAHVRNIPESMTKNAGFSHISDTPNVIVGIVNDSRGNMIPNILVEVKDKDGNPVRAFKTNALGQFNSATPLTNGIYTIELEDPKKQHAFDTIQINATGQIMMPIEVISHDAREELRKALFN